MLVNGLDLRLHVLAIVALVVNLGAGGSLVEELLGTAVRSAFESLLILGYLVIVLGMRAPLRFWRRRGSREDERK